MRRTFDRLNYFNVLFDITCLASDSKFQERNRWKGVDERRVSILEKVEQQELLNDTPNRN